MAPESSPDSKTIFSTNRYVEYVPGTLNVIICIPHGGNLRPGSIPQREAGCFVNGQCVYSHTAGPKDSIRCPVRFKRDSYTKELGFLIAKELTAVAECAPYIVINHLHRSRVDVNTELDKGTFGVPEGIDAWNAYHSFVKKAKMDIKGPGLLLDIHGQSHPEGWIELGYTLSSEQLNTGNYSSKDTSVHSLAVRSGCASSEQVQDLINGVRSFGGLLAGRGYNVVPSPMRPSPGQSNYYTGGYTTKAHGSHVGGIIDAIQLETPKDLRNERESPKYAKDVADTVFQYLEMYYQQDSRKLSQL